jgi:hypothetical protein
MLQCYVMYCMLCCTAMYAQVCGIGCMPTTYGNWTAGTARITYATVYSIDVVQCVSLCEVAGAR